MLSHVNRTKLEIRPENFLTRCARQKTISAFIFRKLDQKYTIVFSKIEMV